MHDRLEAMPEAAGWEDPAKRLEQAPPAVREFILRWGGMGDRVRAKAAA